MNDNTHPSRLSISDARCPCTVSLMIINGLFNLLQWFVWLLEVTDGRVVRTGISVTWNVPSWSGGHEFKPPDGSNLGCVVLLFKLYLNQKYIRYGLKYTHLRVNEITRWQWANTICHDSFPTVAKCTQNNELTQMPNMTDSPFTLTFFAPNAAPIVWNQMRSLEFCVV